MSVIGTRCDLKKFKCFNRVKQEQKYKIKTVNKIPPNT